MKRLVALLLATSALAAPAFAQRKPKAPTPAVTATPARGGWRAARWGMTPPEVLAAFPGEASEVSGAIEIPKLDVAGIEMKAALEFREGRLWRVVLSAPGAPTMAEFNALAAELTKKYGAAAAQKSKPFDIIQLSGITSTYESADSSWIADDTAIELGYVWRTWKDRNKPSSDKVTKTLDLAYSDRAAVSPNL
jgi:hypothetical protein